MPHIHNLNLNLICIAVIPFIVLLGHDFDPGFRAKIIGHLIQIFHNLQNFPRSWIATFFMSDLTSCGKDRVVPKMVLEQKRRSQKCLQQFIFTTMFETHCFIARPHFLLGWPVLRSPFSGDYYQESCIFKFNIFFNRRVYFVSWTGFQEQKQFLL